MEKWKWFLIPISIINFVFILIIISFLIITEPYQKSTIKYYNDSVSDITGNVVSIDKHSNGIGMLVESTQENSTYDKAYVNVTNETTVIKTIYNRTFKPEEINIGDIVEVQFKGPVADSYPVQATAGFVWIKESNIK